MATEKISRAKELLIEAARDLFVQRGYDAVSTREIAERANVNLGAIQYHFGSKEHLFLETIRAAMGGSECFQAARDIPGTFTSKEEAAIAFVRYISRLVEYMVLPQDRHPCRIMFREVLSRQSTHDEIFETLVSSVVKEFIQPADNALLLLLSTIAPELDKRTLELSAHSIIGQCSFYFTHGPFVERLRSRKLDRHESLREVTEHVVTFSLRALGCTKVIIEHALANLSNGEERKEAANEG